MREVMILFHGQEPQ